MEKFKFETPDLTKQNIEKIERIFPNCITEDIDENGNPKKAINFEILKQMLSDEIVEGDEAYEFSWVGKKAAMLSANKPIRKTLRPCKEESVDWENTENLYIEGDNLEVLKLLQESYLGTVKMIYIDPPYNTGNDFIYSDDFSMDKNEYEEASGQINKNEIRLFKENLENNPSFHSDWCSMIYSRLLLAKSLLSEDGVIFISIDDIELNNLKKICDEIFGSSNYIATFVRKNKAGSGHDSSNIAIEFDYILCYCINKQMCKVNKQLVDTSNDPKYKLSDDYVKQRGKYYLRDLDYKGSYSEKLDYPIETPDKSIIYSGGKFGKPNTWRWSKDKFLWGLKNDYIVFKQSSGTWKVYIKQYQYVDNNGNEYERSIPYRALIDFSNGQGTLDFNSIMETNAFPYPKSVELIKHLQNIASNPDSIILDFFSGSATTAHAVMKLNAEDGGNRKFIMVQLQEPCKEDSEAYKAGYKNICEIGKERIRRAAKKIKEENPNAKFDGGFRVFKVADSNMNDVFYSAGEYSQGLLTKAEDNIKSDRTDMDLLYGCLLDWGVPISMRHKEETVNGFKIHIYGNGEIIDLIACFEENISEALIKEIARKQPLKAVFRDSCFANSPSKINAEEIFKLISPDTRIKVI